MSKENVNKFTEEQINALEKAFNLSKLNLLKIFPIIKDQNGCVFTFTIAHLISYALLSGLISYDPDLYFDDLKEETKIIVKEAMSLDMLKMLPPNNKMN